MSKTREDWLHDGIEKYISKLFKSRGYTLPKVRVSVGLPYGRGSRKMLAQHWAPEASDDKVSSIFISPTMDNTDEVLGALIHELVHAVVGNKAGHGKKFRECAEKVGLEGPMLSTTASKQLREDLQKLVKVIGPYPHAKLNLATGRPDKKQTTRMIKMWCGKCNFTARASRMHILNTGPSLCACNKKPMNVEDFE